MVRIIKPNEITDMRNLVIFFILLYAISSSAISQKIGNIWYFGEYCGISFNTSDGKPIAIGGNILKMMEGCATVSDKVGNIDFYTDGSNVITKNNDWMKINNSYKKYNLNGCSSSSQGVIIVPFTNDSLKYYIFTTDCFENKYSPLGINYSVVDMRVNNGFGNIQPFNINIAPSSLEKITATKHKNGKDYWVVSHAYNSDLFYAFLVDGTGVHKPINSRIAPVIGDYNNTGDQGYLKISSDGKKIAAAYTQLRNVYIYDFNNETGEVSNGASLFDANKGYEFYGVEFSPDASKLYVSFFALDANTIQGLEKGIFQLDMKAGNVNAIRNSAVVVLNEKGFPPGAMQLGPDGRIYVAKDISPTLHIINRPNKKYPQCDFQPDGLFLDIDNSGRKCHLGLPNAMTSIFYIKVVASATIPACEGDTVILTADIDASARGYSIQWTGPNGFHSNQRTVSILNIKKNASGWYYVQVNLNDKIARDSVYVEVSDSPFTEIIATPNKTFCEGDSVILSAHPYNPQLNYTWSTTDKGEHITVKKSGRYFLWVKNAGDCEYRDSIDITVIPKPDVNIVPNGSLDFCEGDSVILEITPYLPDVEYKWNTGESTKFLTVKKAGEYKVYARNSTECMDSASVNISVLPLPAANITEGNDISICSGDTLRLNAKPDGHKYYWSTGDTTQTISVSRPGIYTLIVKNANLCSDTAYCRVRLYPNIPAKIIGNTSICKGDSSLLSLTEQFAKYSWSTGDTSKTIYAKERGWYLVSTVDFNGCHSKDSIYIDVYEVSINSSDLDSIDFGRVFIDSTKTLTVYIRNEDAQDVTIGNISFGNTLIFHHNNTLPAVVKSGQSYPISITFTPYDILNFDDSIEVEITSPCSLIIGGKCKGSGIVKMIALLPDTTGEIGAKDFCIPVYSYFVTRRNISDASSWLMKISHNVTLFLPNKYTPSVFSISRRTVTLEGSSETTNQTKQMAEYCGTVLLGDVDETPLLFTEFQYNNSNVIVETINGSLKLKGLCVRDLSRLQLLETSYLQTSPTPANDEINIEYNLAEDGDFTLKLVNMLGQEIDVIAENKNAKKGSRFIRYNTGNLSSGTYFMIMQINGTIIRKQILINN